MIVRGTGYVRGNRKAAGTRLAGHFKYIEYRPLGEIESRTSRSIFNKEEDRVSRKDAVGDVMDHTSSAVNFHKIMLSPGQDEPIESWKVWTREVMHDLEEHVGKDLHWYAVEHHNTDHAHVHVVVAGAGENHNTGKAEPIKLYPHDYQFLRESGREHSGYDFYHELDHVNRDLDVQDREEPMMAHDLQRDQSYERGDFDR
jgi:type IV secretory pathway VirD2 relaxase